MMPDPQIQRNEPSVLSETEHFAVVYKPSFIHSVPLKKNEGGTTLLDWYGRLCPQALKLTGRKEMEGGLLHRLDYETEGLILIAKNQSSMNALLAQQEQGFFIKEYGALSSCPQNIVPLRGFPPFSQNAEPGSIQSYFRSWGPGRKAVRPAVSDSIPRGKKAHPVAADQGKPYVTEVLETEDFGEGFIYFRLRLKRGFRHQIRCHLAWIGKPILNDTLYGGMVQGGTPENLSRRGAIALRAEGFSFYDPVNGAKREYRIPTYREGEEV